MKYFGCAIKHPTYTCTSRQVPCLYQVRYRCGVNQNAEVPYPVVSVFFLPGGETSLRGITIQENGYNIQSQQGLRSDPALISAVDARSLGFKPAFCTHCE